MTQERIYYCGPWRRPYYWRLKEDPITEDPKESLINEKSKEGPITAKPKDNSTNEDPQESQYLQRHLRRKLTLFGFFGNGIW